MTKTPFFSVVIPLYNKENYIEATINSVLNQTFTDFEIIIVNDGSTDASKTIVESFKDNKIKLFSTKNQGASHARNFGIKNSNGNYIAFLDADDIWYTNHLSSMFDLINEFPNVGMYCNRYKFLLGNKHLKKAKIKGVSQEYKGIIKNYFESNLFDPIVNSSVVAIPINVFNDIGFFDEKLKSGQDTFLWTQIAIKYKVAIGNIITSTYIKNDNSLSKSIFTKDRILFLDKFDNEEKTNSSLKAFMDMNRFAVALNYKIRGDIVLSKSIFNKIDNNNLNLKQRFIFSLPHKLLKITYQLKNYLDKKGIFFYLYR